MRTLRIDIVVLADGGKGHCVAYKRLQLAQLIMKTGFHRSWFGNGPASLLIVNYHRLWPAPGSGSSVFDHGVFGPDASVFRRQMEWLRSTTRVLDEEGLLGLHRQASHARGIVYSAVTFDDAYVDCFAIARPILDELGIRALFFVPVEMIESRRLGWWDIAAFLLKESRCKVIRVGSQTLDLQRDFSRSLRRVLDMFKLEPADTTDDLLAALSSACKVALPNIDRQSAELMSWEQIKALGQSGHAIGSHTFSHRVLATLSPEEQAREILGSRRELAAHLGREVRSFAYPVGGPQHFNETSVALVQQAGYEQAFTFNTGMGTLPIADRFRIPRESANSVDILKAKVLMPALMGIRHQKAV